ncbi:tetratricopeptide repeat protein [Methylocystis sp. H62]|uniref:DUF805 domain-containing protein n=1 Tax=Methylocystis sp. H62 TaxID=2785789 RepID=UPI0018C333AF|nr:DUF805 domain-containing protein [Methylocystis sp. H62]MBG0795852.1 tetratricopeptide repeat protein [Methylocystis sp. H62]
MQRIWKQLFAAVLLVSRPDLACATTTGSAFDLCLKAKAALEKIDRCSTVISTSRKRAQLERAYLRRGNAYKEIDRLEEAAKDFTEIIQLNPKIAGYYDNRQNVLKLLFRFNEALEDANRTVQLAPNQSFVYLSRAILYETMQRYDEALQDYTSGISINPGDAGLYVARGRIFAREGQANEAIADFAKALDIEPENRLALRERGFSFRSVGQIDAAIRDLEAFARLEPGDKEAIDALNQIKPKVSAAAPAENLSPSEQAKKNTIHPGTTPSSPPSKATALQTNNQSNGPFALAVLYSITVLAALALFGIILNGSQAAPKLKTLLFSFKGRLNRLHFLFVQLGIIACLFVINTSIIILLVTSPPSVLAAGLLICELLMLLPLLWIVAATTVKRLHDLNNNGYYVIIFSIPTFYVLLLLFGILNPFLDYRFTGYAFFFSLAFILFYVAALLLVPGTRGANRFGADLLPKKPGPEGMQADIVQTPLEQVEQTARLIEEKLVTAAKSAEEKLALLDEIATNRITEWMSGPPPEKWPPIVVKTYTGRESRAIAQFQSEANEMAAVGYFPVSQSWTPGHWGCGSFIVALLLCFLFVGFFVFLYMLIVPPEGTLTVTYQRRSLENEQVEANTGPTTRTNAP